MPIAHLPPQRLGLALALTLHFSAQAGWRSDLDHARRQQVVFVEPCPAHRRRAGGLPRRRHRGARRQGWPRRAHPAACSTPVPAASTRPSPTGWPTSAPARRRRATWTAPPSPCAPSAARPSATGRWSWLATLIQQPGFPPRRSSARGAHHRRHPQSETQPTRSWPAVLRSGGVPDHAYGRLPTVDSVAGLTRDDLAAFHARYYTARGATVSIVGDLSRAEAEAIAARLTAGLPPARRCRRAPTPRRARRRSACPIRPPRPTSRSASRASAAAIRTSFPLLVGNYILGGGGFVSRLTSQVREQRGYAYSVQLLCAPARRRPFQIGLQTKGSQADDALRGGVGDPRRVPRQGAPPRPSCRRPRTT